MFYYTALVSKRLVPTNVLVFQLCGIKILAFFSENFPKTVESTLAIFPKKKPKIKCCF
jgi:hypothetical protein